MLGKKTAIILIGKKSANRMIGSKPSTKNDFVYKKQVEKKSPLEK